MICEELAADGTEESLLQTSRETLRIGGGGSERSSNFFFLSRYVCRALVGGSIENLLCSASPIISKSCLARMKSHYGVSI